MSCKIKFIKIVISMWESMKLYPRNPGARSVYPEYHGTISKKSGFICFFNFSYSDIERGWVRAQLSDSDNNGCELNLQVRVKKH